MSINLLIFIPKILALRKSSKTEGGQGVSARNVNWRKGKSAGRINGAGGLGTDGERVKSSDVESGTPVPSQSEMKSNVEGTPYFSDVRSDCSGTSKASGRSFGGGMIVQLPAPWRKERLDNSGDADR